MHSHTSAPRNSDTVRQKARTVPMRIATSVNVAVYGTLTVNPFT